MVSEFVTIEIGVLGHALAASALLQQISSLSKPTATQLVDSAVKAIVTASHDHLSVRLCLWTTNLQRSVAFCPVIVLSHIFIAFSILSFTHSFCLTVYCLLHTTFASALAKPKLYSWLS